MYAPPRPEIYSDRDETLLPVLCAYIEKSVPMAWGAVVRTAQVVAREVDIGLDGLLHLTIMHISLS